MLPATMTQKFGMLPAEAARTQSGLELMRSILSGAGPQAPIGKAANFLLHEVGEGSAVFVGTPTYDFYNPIGTVHGGWIATLLDSCMSCAVHTLVKAGHAYTTLELKVNFVRPVLEKTGPMRAEGRVIHGGSRTATAEGKLLDAGGKLYAHGTVTCMIFPLP
jgi:uncharacterized protein (TIGR00369 family)